MITLKAKNIFTDIEGEVDPAVYKKLERKLSFRPAGYVFSPAYNRLIRDANGKVIRRMWDGWKKQCWKNTKRTYFPTGLLSLAREHFDKNKITYRTVDLRQKPIHNINLSMADDFKFRPYQDEVIESACSKTRGIIEIATGGGKTCIGAGIIQQLSVSPFIFFVTSIDLLTQTKESLENVLRDNGKPITVGQIGGGVIDIRDINVMTVQTAVRALGKSWNKFQFDKENKDDKTPIEERKEDIQELIRTTQGSIADEVQHWRATTCQLVCRELKNSYYTFGMSATPYRDDDDDMLIQACFGKNIATIGATRLIDEGFLVRPTIKMIHLKQPKSNYSQWQSIYKDQVVENEAYNNIIANIANKFSEAGRLVLVLVTQIAHGKDLADMINGAVFLSGSSTKKKREEGIRQLRNRDISCIVSTNIFDEGIDVKPLDTVILAGQGKSKVTALQRIGRILRPYEDENIKKTRATAIDFCLYQKYLKDHAKQRLKMYASEPGFVVEELET